jgi:hypothetical protein
MKEIFQLQKDRVDWLAEVVANPIFQEAVVFAIAQYTRAMAGDPGDSLRIRGGVEVLGILKDLPAPKIERKPDERSKLKL